MPRVARKPLQRNGAAHTKSREIIGIINKAFGSEVLTTAADPRLIVRYLRTGIAPIDHLLGGGLARGRMVEVFGDYSTLKSYIGYCAIAQTQADGGMAALIDTEHAFDPEWAASLGVDLETLILWPQPNTEGPRNAERALDVAETLIRGRVDLVVFDSIAAALPRAEEEVQLSGDKNIQPARLASLMSTALRKLTAANSETAIMFINQTRINVGVMFGTNEAVPGGKAMGFYASQRLALRKSGKDTIEEDYYTFEVKDGQKKPIKKKVKKTIGTRIRATLEKSKLNQPHRDEYFTFSHETGQIDTWYWLATQAIELGVVDYQGGWWWVRTNEDPKKMRLSDFRGAVDEEELLKLMAKRTQKPLVSPGKSLPARSKVASQNGKSSSAKVPASTRTRGQAASKTTVVTRKTSTRSKTR
ncbi:hypothetical protein GCM10010423_65460 [Streptomyces levis]|uniref:Protein RecA n=1 Tax=Streptomyces levis TaxID=285566 RepID=A0ABN3P6P5_9ACTN